MRNKLNKITLAVIIAAFSVSSVFADTMYLKDGQEIKDAVVTEIGDSDVKYKIGGRQVVYTAKKSSIAVIIYDDGTRETFGSGNSMSNAVQSQPNEKYENASQEEARTRHGIRIAYNVSQTDGVDYGYGHSSIGNTGGGFEAGWQMSIPISGSITFNTGLNFISRSPINETDEGCFPSNSYPYTTTCIEFDIKETEFALSTPILFQGMPFGGPVFYINGGLQIDFPFNSEVEVSSGSNNVSIGFNRTIVDVGVVLGIGWFVGEHLAIDWKLAVVGITSFDGTGKLYQAALGLNYWL
jgi:hypothetical protein